MTTKKPPERWITQSGRPGGFTVLSADNNGWKVKVERSKTNKNGETVWEEVERDVPAAILPFFLKGYKKETK